MNNIKTFEVEVGVNITNHISIEGTDVFLLDNEGGLEMNLGGKIVNMDSRSV